MRNAALTEKCGILQNMKNLFYLFILQNIYFQKWVRKF